MSKSGKDVFRVGNVGTVDLRLSRDTEVIIGNAHGAVEIGPEQHTHVEEEGQNGDGSDSGRNMKIPELQRAGSSEDRLPVFAM